MSLPLGKNVLLVSSRRPRRRAAAPPGRPRPRPASLRLAVRTKMVRTTNELLLLLTSVVAAAVAAPPPPPPSSASSLSVFFGFGWRFHLQSPAEVRTGSTCSFERSASNMSCSGASLHEDTDHWTPEDCQLSCCADPDCMVWQYFAKDMQAPVGQRNWAQGRCVHGGGDVHCGANISVPGGGAAATAAGTAVECTFDGGRTKSHCVGASLPPFQMTSVHHLMTSVPHSRGTACRIPAAAPGLAVCRARIRRQRVAGGRRPARLRDQRIVRPRW
jgi:hypothetical protein